MMHPMVAVPDAIRMVLETCANILLQEDPSSSSSCHTEEVSSNAFASRLLLGRILAKDVLMSEPGYPPYRASIMDGYAIQTYTTKSTSTPRPTPTSTTKSNLSWTHQVVGRRHAGASVSDVPSRSNHQQQQEPKGIKALPPAVYVTTGAKVPDNYDCVVPIEQIIIEDDEGAAPRIQIMSDATIEPHKWIRNVGCDITAGFVVLPRGFRLDPVSLGLLQQSGQPTICLAKPIRVGVLSTGNELLVSTDTWSTSQQQQQTQEQQQTQGHHLLQTGEIPDVNKPILMALLQSFKQTIEPVDLGMERDDDTASMTKTLQEAVDTCDVVLTTGGISMGETDIVEDVLVDGLGGTLHFGRLNMKPGKPTTFVTVPSSRSQKKPCLVFALPGNPVSATVCTHLVVRPALSMLEQWRINVPGSDKVSNTNSRSEDVVQKMVETTRVQPEVMASLAHDIKLDMGRPEYHRVTLNFAATTDGRIEYTASSTGVQQSSRLMSLRDAQGLLVLPKGTTQQPKAVKGQTYLVLLLEESHLCPSVRFQDSQHLKSIQPKHRLPSRVIITQVSENDLIYPFFSITDISNRIQSAFSGSRSGSIMVTACREFMGPADNLVSDFQKYNNAESFDFWILVCLGSFLYNLDVSQVLRNNLEKVADAVALQARRGAASQDGTAALFEPIVGYLQNGGSDGCVVISLPANGVEGALDNVRGLLKHALNVAREKPHNEHHKHT